ncbi:RNA polymerase subunit sigma, partial [Bacillus paranthracis]|nr:RNA polymerase subunit sigma [Bacillus paranthracis]
VLQIEDSSVGTLLARAKLKFRKTFEQMEGK